MAQRHRRTTPQQQTGNRGQHQLADRFEEYSGWKAGAITPDSGEDFIVSIFDDGYSSGLSFYAQIKSTTKPNKKLQNGDISRTFEVKDLQHWEDHFPCVFLFAWHVNERVGNWISVSDAIKELQQKNPQWRDKKTVTVNLPSGNLTDDAGLKRIRQQVAKFAEPSVAAGRPLSGTVTMSSNDPVEKACIEAFQRNRATGDEVEVEGRARFVEWFARLHNIDEVRIRFKVKSTPSKDPLPYRVNVIPSNGAAVSIHYIDMRAVKGGSEEVTLSNHEQKTPFQFKMIWRKDGWMTITCTINLTDFDLSIEDERHAVAVQQAFATGGKLQMIPLEPSKKYPTVNMEYAPGLMPSPDAAYLNLLEKLHTIEQKADVKLSLPDRTITREESKLIDELVAVLTTGHDKEEYHPETTAQVSVPREENEGLTVVKALIESYNKNADWEVTITDANFTVSLFNQEVNLGPMMQRITARVAAKSVTNLKRIVAKGKSPAHMILHVTDARIKSTFYKYLPNDEGKDVLDYGNTE